MLTQLTLPTICCTRVMHGHGSVKGRIRRRCPVCGRTAIDHPLRTRGRVWVADGRRRIQLGLGHIHANSGGWQYYSRYIISTCLGRVLLTEEHVHHKDLDRLNDNPSNLELRLASNHGKYHRHLAILTEFRQGKLFELSTPISL